MKRLEQLSYMELKPLLEQIKYFEENIRQKHGVNLGFIYYDRGRKEDGITPTAHQVAIVLYHCIETQLGVSKEAFASKSRTGEEVKARQFFAMVMKLKSGTSLKNIGEYIGGRDHTSVINLVQGFEDAYDTEPAYRNKWADFLAFVDQALKQMDVIATPQIIQRMVEIEGEIMQLAERLATADGLSVEVRYAIIKKKMELNDELEQLKSKQPNE